MAKLTLSYEGTGLCGWQRTNMGASVEAHLLKALFPFCPDKDSLDAASRTDSGVHALGQVVSTTLPCKYPPLHMRKILNAKLPRSIRITEIEKAPDTFHASIDARSKEYIYTIDNQKFASPFTRHTAWHYPIPLDLGLMQNASKALLGTHDFSAFANPPMHHNRTRSVNSIELTKDGHITIRIQGKSFLHNMVRIIVGTLVYVGSGKIPPEALSKILLSLDRTLAGPTAPAHGLLLNKICY